MNNKEKKMTPEVRFSGFNDDWELCKFEDSFNFPVSTNSLSRAMLNYDRGEVKSVHYGDVLIKYPAILNVKTAQIPFINNGTRENFKSNLLKNGDLIFADAAEDESVGKAVEVNALTDEYLVSGLHTIVARPKGKMAEFFLGYYINSEIYHRQLLRLMQGTKVSAISKKNLLETEVSFPTRIEEQEKIGNFFKQLDDIIALHQDKLTQLKKLKDAFLQQMFPTGYEKSPRLRFGNFEKDWENCKLGKMLQEFSVKSKVENEYNVLSSTNNGMELREGRVSGASNIGYKIVENGDLVLSPQNLWLGNININNIGRGLVSPSYKTFKFIKVESNFINPQLRTAKMLEEYKNASTQGASVVRRNLEIDSFYQIPLRIPVRVEQDKIGLFFSNFDQYIDLHQKKLDTLKATKKAFLQKMFI